MTWVLIVCLYSGQCFERGQFATDAICMAAKYPDNPAKVERSYCKIRKASTRSKHG